VELPLPFFAKEIASANEVSLAKKRELSLRAPTRRGVAIPVDKFPILISMPKQIQISKLFSSLVFQALIFLGFGAWNSGFL